MALFGTHTFHLGLSPWQLASSYPAIFRCCIRQLIGCGCRVEVDGVDRPANRESYLELNHVGIVRRIYCWSVRRYGLVGVGSRMREYDRTTNNKEEEVSSCVLAICRQVPLVICICCHAQLTPLTSHLQRTGVTPTKVSTKIPVE
jgi:hypothetical protein